MDSENFTIYLFNGEASVLYATYYIRADANSNPEGICVDKKRGCIWVCEDMEGIAVYTIANQYKIPAIDIRVISDNEISF